jgi:hypothetical protein
VNPGATITAGPARLTRVEYFDIALGPEAVGLTAAEVHTTAWAAPTWATEEDQVRVGQAIWVIETGGRRVAVDPCQAADTFIRTGPEAIAHQDAVSAALDAAGFPPDTIDTVVLSHLDGIGMAAAVDTAGDWSPLFPNARVVISAEELAWVHAHPEIQGAPALEALVQHGAVDAVEPPHEVAPGVVLELSGGHSPGHALIRVGDDVVFLGHLAVHPVNVATEPRPGAHIDMPTAATTLETELATAAARRSLVIGPLWPAPGAARVTGPPWVITPAT